ncbi:MAG TPA: aminotransferase class I/II-fold pyridoxal phosphate-dependent enzyme [Acidimicrobiales bacterium]|nr:aminotransferase class I/II-fold pyridoxal phosphate-dependent enzyme [Acidimicrobiales bacterium]
MAVIPPPSPHGGDGPRLAAALGVDVAAVLDLSLSLNPLAPDVATLAADALGSLRRYPDPARATAGLAEAVGVEPDQVLLTNGGAEAIALVAADQERGRVDEPEFSLYRRHLATVDAGAPRWRSNPHNPTGLLARAGERAAVWDEAFYPLATGRWTRGDEEGVVVGSLTKVFACPGLRLGYVLAGGDLIERLRRRQPAWAVNGLALALLPRLLERTDLPGWARGIAALRDDLAALLAGAGLRPRPSDAPWLLVDGAEGLRERLAPCGVLVRDATSFALAGSARIAVPGPAGLERLARALAATA